MPTKRKKPKKRVSQTSASDSGRTLANFRHNNPNRRGVRKGGILRKSKRQGSSSKRNRKKNKR